MTERIRGLGFGRMAVAMIGVVAMVALATGAVAASGGSAKLANSNQPLVLTDATDSASATGSAIAAASCDPTLDQIEDAAEKSAKAALPSGATMAPEGTEPPHCAPAGIKGEGAGDKDGDSHANQKGIDHKAVGPSGIGDHGRGGHDSGSHNGR